MSRFKKLIAFRYGKYFLVVFAEDASEITKENTLSYDEVKELLLQEKVNLGEDK